MGLLLAPKSGPPGTGLAVWLEQGWALERCRSWPFTCEPQPCPQLEEATFVQPHNAPLACLYPHLHRPGRAGKREVWPHSAVLALLGKRPKEWQAWSSPVLAGYGAGTPDNEVSHVPCTNPCTHLNLHAGTFFQPLHSLGKGGAAGWDGGYMLMVGLYLQHNHISSGGWQEPCRHHTLQLPLGAHASGDIGQWRLLGSPCMSS